MTMIKWWWAKNILNIVIVEIGYNDDIDNRDYWGCINLVEKVEGW